MKRILTIIFTLHASLFTLHLTAQDTFSIVAIDTVTGEIGSAGASCIDENQIPGGAIIISDILPGRGAIHTQSYYHSTNQQNAHARMEEGMSPEEIIQWLVDNDAQNNPQVRQYGIVDVDSSGHPRSAAFTGTNCLDYKNHITGPNYSIQGNILLGEEILTGIEAGFLFNQGTLAEKLMAALQGANVPGADSRCAGEGVSSLSAFIRVAWPSDTNGVFYLDLNVPSTPYGVEPIDSLQTLFDEWLGIHVGVNDQNLDNDIIIYPNPARDALFIKSQQSTVNSHLSKTSYNGLKKFNLILFNSLGKKIEQFEVTEDELRHFVIELHEYPDGIYTLNLTGDKFITTKKFIKAQ
jgi:uncharacterized Ntn-hydrolase superfamily protein